MSVFINMSNHGSKAWGKKQREKAEEYGKIIDIPFPEIDPLADENEINKLADEYMKKIQIYDNPVVMIQGEFTFTYAMLERLKERGIVSLASCSRRVAKETVKEDGTWRQSIFEFERFRKYYK